MTRAYLPYTLARGASQWPQWGAAPVAEGYGAPVALPMPGHKKRTDSDASLPEITHEIQRDLLGKVIGGLDYVGGVMDKPGAASRGMISGLIDTIKGEENPEWGGGLLNLIPYSDTKLKDTAVGTSREDRVSGRDILDKLGYPENKPGLHFNDPVDLIGDVLGFGVEVATDPLLLVTGPLGSVVRGSKAAKALKPVGAAARSVDDFKGHVGDFLKHAATGTGDVLEKTPAHFAQELREGQRGLIGLKVPFAKEPFAVFGKGEWAAKMMERLFYGGSQYVNPTPFIRGLFSHVPGINAGTPAVVQRAADLAFTERQRYLSGIRDLAPAVHVRSQQLLDRFQDIAQKLGAQGDQKAFNDFTREMIETKAALPKTDQLVNALKRSLKMPNADIGTVVDDVQSLSKSYYEYFDGLRKVEDVLYRRYLGLGGKGGLLEDEFTRHYGRGAARTLKTIKDGEFGKSGFKFWLARRSWLRDYPGGSAGINRASRDKMIAASMGLDQKEYRKELRRILANPAGPGVGFLPPKKHREFMAQNPTINPWEAPMMTSSSAVERGERLLWESHVKPDLERAVREGVITPDRMEEAAKEWWSPKLAMVGDKVKEKPSRLRELYHHLRRLPEEVTETGIFDKSLADDFFTYMDSLIRNMADLRYAHNMLRQPGIVHFASQGGLPDGLSLREAWTAGEGSGFRLRGLYSFALDNYADELSHIDEAVRGGMRVALDQGANASILKKAFGEDFKALDAFVSDMQVNEATAYTLKSLNEVTKPETRGAMLKALDAATTIYKGYLTIPFTSFHTRNHLSGIWQAWTEGKISIKELLAGHIAAAKHAATKGAEPLQYIDEIKQLGIIGPHGSIVDILGEEAAERIAKVPAGRLGGITEPIRDVISGKTKLSQAANPLNLRGFREIDLDAAKREALRDVPQNLIAEMGDKAYNYVEFLNRAGFYEALRRKGYSPAQAAHYVKRTQFDYSEMSNFERTVMRRLVPFWSWKRRSIPYTMTQLLESPGGRRAQTIRAFTDSNDDLDEGEVYTPSFLRERMAVPVGGEPDAQSFFRQAGIPIEDLNDIVFSHGVPMKRSFEKAAAQTHPVLVAAIEMLTGRQLYSGRDLKHRESLTEAMFGTAVPALDQMTLKSPFSRFFTEYDIPNAVGKVRRAITGAEPTTKVHDIPWWQTAMNLGTGAKFGTYDTEKWRAIDAVEAQKKILQGTPEIRSSAYHYVAPQYIGTPKEQPLKEKLRLLRALEKQQQKLMQKKQKEAGKSGK